MVVLSAKSEAGTTTLYHSLNPKARWSYNNLIKCCLKLDTPEKRAAFELDYNQLIGKKFLGEVTLDTYEKEIKVQNEDGTFSNDTEVKETYKITSYDFAK